MTNEFLLQDRLQKIRQIIGKYGEENFYISFSGGKDSTVLSALIDLAIPGNKIPRVYANTGIEYRLILEFVEREREAAPVGTGYFEAHKANKADPGRSRVPVQKQISLDDFINLSKFGRYGNGKRLPGQKTAAKRNSQARHTFMPQNLASPVHTRIRTQNIG